MNYHPKKKKKGVHILNAEKHMSGMKGRNEDQVQTEELTNNIL